jgi:hypothetical protein
LAKKKGGGLLKLAVIAGPYNAPTDHEIYDNIQKARKVAEKYIKLGYAVICPHLNTAFMGGLVDEAVFYMMCQEFVLRADTIIMITGWSGSKGSIEELGLAVGEGKEIIYE